MSLTFVIVGALSTPATAQVPCEVTFLSPSDAANGPNSFGTSVAIDGDYAVLGARTDTPSNTGAAYVFKREGLQWVEQTKLFGSAVGFHANFGWSVDIDGDRLVAGAPYMDPVGGAPGQAYVFERTGETWKEVAVLTPSVSFAIDAFGIDVAIDGDVIVVGAFYRGAAPGKAFVFRWNGSAWVEEIVLFVPAHIAFDGFGFSVDVAGASIAVGAYDDGSGQSVAGAGDTPGAVYAYEWDGAVWLSNGILLGDQVGYADSFGQELSIRTEFLIIGARTDNSIAPAAGAAYLFRRVGPSWQFHEKLTRTNGAPQDWFGIGVAIHESKVLVANFKSSVFLYKYDGLSWNALPSLVGGSAVTVSGSYGLASSGYVYALDAIAPCIPTTSSWSLVMLFMILLAAATILLRKSMRITVAALAVVLVPISSGPFITLHHSEHDPTNLPRHRHVH